MANAHEDFFRKLYIRTEGGARRPYKCTLCGDELSIVDGCVADEPCDNCGVVAWRELTEEEYLSNHLSIEDLKLRSNELASELANREYSMDAAEPMEWAKILGKFVQSLEGFGDEQTAAWLRLNGEKRPKIIEYLLDDFYTRDFLNKARKMVDRTMKLTAMVPRATPDPGVNIYLREATRSYIAGLWKSTVALSRTTLEVALRHRLKEGQGFVPTDDKFETVIEFAHMCRVIDHAHFAMAEEVRKNGNDVVHGSPADEPLAWRVLWSTRGVLDHLYSH